MSKKNIVLCFCKQPVTGLVKSRLAKDIGKQRAADIYETMLTETLKTLTGLNFKTYLYCYPDTLHPTLEQYKNSYGVELKKQSGGNLGVKMYQAIKDQLSENTNIVLIGSDCLEINASYIKNAFNELNTGNEIVLGPTEDGGYALIGASIIDASIFQGISWSTKDVYKQTESKLRTLAWNFSSLAKIRDLDDLDDYEYFSSHEKYRHLFN